MKRKILSLTLGLCMMLGLMVNAYAAAPSATGTEAPVIADILTSDGTVISAEDIKVTAVQDVASLPAEEAAVLTTAAEAITKAASTAEFLESAGITAAVRDVLASTSVAAEDLAPAATFSVSASGEAAKVLAEAGSVQLTFKVNGVADGDTVVVLVFNGTSWVVVPAFVRNGNVVGTFTSLGAVVIMTAKDATAAARVASPQTNGASLDGVLICGAALGLAVLLVCLKRSRRTV